MNSKKKRTSISFLLSVIFMASVLIDFLSLTVNAITFPFEKDSFKVLSIGNSFSANATEYLYELAVDAGLDNIVIGNLYIGGCDIETHWQNAKANSSAYSYDKYKDGKCDKKQDIAMFSALLDEKWDCIVLQQASHYSGIEETYNEDLTSLINYIRVFSPFSKLAWHMTWTYTDDSTNPKFALYNNDSQTMYYAIVSAAINKIATRDEISYIIPSGTVIRNLQTSYIRDNMYKDNKHMNDIGCYAVGLAFLATLSECNVEEINWIPESKHMRYDYLNAIQEAVINAVETPFSVTRSHYKCNHDTYPDTVINTLIKIPGIKATCKYKGLTEGIFCFGCDKFIKAQKEVAIAPHNYGSWTLTAATTSKDGGKKRTCKSCGKTENQPIHRIKSVDFQKTVEYTGKSIKPSVTVTDSSGKKLKLNTDYTVKYPKAKKIGEYTIRITFKGKYSGKVEKTFKIVPKAVQISSIKSKPQKKLVITWKKPVMSVSGFELQYSLSKKFTDKKTTDINIKDEKTLSKIISKIKADMNYYFRIRTYKIVDKKKYYSPWSKAVKFKT